MRTAIFFMVSSVFVIFASSCNVLYPDEELSLKRTDYTGKELKTNGYYYRHFYSEDSAIYTSISFLYRNGIILSCGSFSTANLNIVENEMLKRYNMLRKQKVGWGVFLINNNQLLTEQWNATTGFGLPIVRNTGYIENDTTFFITESYYSDIKKTEKKKYVYNFKQFDNKPDSTNAYIY
jgi:hypothetical protein